MLHFLVSLPPLKTFSIPNLPLDIRGYVFINQFALQGDNAIGGCPLRYGRMDVTFWPARGEEMDVPRPSVEAVNPFEQCLAPSISARALV